MFIFEDKFLPYSDEKYKLNKFGDVLDLNNEQIETVILNNEKFVKLNWCNGHIYYKLSLIVAIVKFNIKIPPTLWDKIKIIYDDGDINNTNIVNISYGFLDGPLEVIGVSGFYYIPYHTGYAINIKGELMNINKRTLINWTATKSLAKKNVKGGYRTCRGVRDFGNSVFISRHRSIGLVFLEYNNNPLKLVINHKDGVPGNDDPSNLEWMTYSQNNKHAIDTGLMPNSVVPVLMKNLKTGEIKRFNSISDCAKEINKTFSFVNIRMRKGSRFRYYDNLAFKMDDGEEWPILSDRIKSICGAYSIAARNIFTGEIILFNSIEETIKELNVWREAVSDNAIYEKNEPVNGYNFRFLTDDIKWPIHCNKDLCIYKLFLNRKCSRTGVIITDEDGNELKFYESINLAAEAYSVSHSTIIRTCRKKKMFNGIKMSLYRLNNNGPFIQ